MKRAPAALAISGHSPRVPKRGRVKDRYQKRISGPMLDRIDIQVRVPHVDYEKLTGNVLGERSAIVRPRVEAARERQRARFEGPPLHTIADLAECDRIETHHLAEAL